MLPAQFEYAAPDSVSDAVALLAARSDAMPLAGGHSLLPDMKLQRAAPSLLVDLRKLRELRGIEKADGHGGVRIGVMAVLADVAANPMVREGYAALVEAIESIGDPQVRNRATLGGSMLARAQGADIPPVLLAYDAVLTVAGTRGDRLAPVEGLVNDPHESLLGAGELATWIDIPEASGGSAYEKFKNPANCYAICGVAVWLERAGDGTVARCRVAVAGASSRAERLREVEDLLEGRRPSREQIATATERAGAELEYPSDLAASGEYRRYLTGVLAERALTRAATRAGFR